MGKQPPNCLEIGYYALLGVIALIGAIAGGWGSYAAFAAFSFPLSFGGKFTHGVGCIVMAAVLLLSLRLTYRLWLRAFTLYQEARKKEPSRGGPSRGGHV